MELTHKNKIQKKETTYNFSLLLRHTASVRIICRPTVSVVSK